MFGVTVFLILVLLLIVWFFRATRAPESPSYDAFALLMDRVKAIERRLRKLESAPPDLTVPDVAVSVPEAEAAEPEEVPAVPKEPTSAAVGPVYKAPTRSELLHPEEPPAPTVPETAPTGPAERPPVRTGPAPDLEQTIGLKWAGWVGALVLVVGVGLGIKYAYDNGWLGRFPATARLVLMSLVGFALLAAGEIVYRRVHVVSAAALFGAGIAVLFLVSYAGNLYYQVYGYETAFAFALLTTLVGSGVAIRARLLSTAVLAQLGGQVAPVLLSSGQPPGVALLAYTFMLQAIALVMAYWGNSAKWWALRGLSLATTAWWVLICLLDGTWGTGLAHEVFWFGIVSAAVYQGELLASAARRDGNSDGGAGRAWWQEGLASAAAAPGYGMIFSLLVTAGLTAIGLYVFDPLGGAARGGFTSALAVICLTGGLGLQSSSKRGLQALAAGFLLQGFALLILTIPVAFDEQWLSLGWCVLALAFATVGARFDHGVARGASLLTWLLAVIWLAIESDLRPNQEVWLTLLDEPLRRPIIVAWLLAIAGQIIAWFAQRDLRDLRRPPPTEWERATTAASIAATATWAIAALAGLPPLGATLALIGWAWLLVAASFVPQRLALLLQSCGVLAFGVAKWVAVDTLADRLTPGWDPLRYLPVLNPVMGLGLLLAASVVGVVRLRGKSLSDQPATEPMTSSAGAFRLMVIVVTIITIGLSFEVERAVARGVRLGFELDWPVVQFKLLSLTMVWSVAAVTLALAARQLRYSTFLPLMIQLTIAAKFLLIDMLYWHAIGRSASVAVLVNFQLLALGVVVAATIATRTAAPADRWGPFPLAVFVVALVTIALSLEIDRAILRAIAFGYDLGWPTGQFELFSLTMLWSAAAVALGLIARRLGHATYLPLSVQIVIAAKFLLIDMLSLHPMVAPVAVMILVNMQVLAAAVVVAATIATRNLTPADRLHPVIVTGLRVTANITALLILLWAGTLEIDRAFAAGLIPELRHPRVATQVAVTIYWSAFAIATVVAGFCRRSAGLRYFGLVLFAVTLVKVAIVDLREVRYDLKILSCLGLGLLLLGTSVLYGKLSPRLLGEPPATPEGLPPG